jgi:PAS domain S-box-containing protein
VLAGDRTKLSSPHRLQALRCTGLVSEAMVETFDRIAGFACKLLNTPTALVSVLDDTRQIIKGAHGLELGQSQEFALSQTLCQYVVSDARPLVVSDIDQERLLQDHPAVIEHGIRAYCGIPLRTPDGEVIGALCVIQMSARAWSTEDLNTLQSLAFLCEADIAARYYRSRADRLGAELRGEGAGPSRFDHEDVLSLAEQSAGIGVWDHDLATRQTWGRPQFFRNFGLEPTTDPVPIEQLRKLRHPEDSLKVVEGFESALKHFQETYETEYRIIRPDGEVRWIFGRGRVVRDSGGKPIRYSGVDLDVTQRKAVETALRESRRRLKAVFDNASVAIILLDQHGCCRVANKATEKLTGHESSNIRGRRYDEVLGTVRLQKDDPLFVDAPATFALPTTSREQFTRIITLKDGSFCPVEITASPVHGDSDEVAGTVIEIRDIRVEIDNKRRVDLLINELNHRVKNTLATVQSIVAFGLRFDDPTRARRSIEQRLIALAHSHDVLTTENWRGADLAVLLRGVLAAFPTSDCITLSGPTVFLRPKMAITLSIAFHELATNAVKHGALSIAGGQIFVEWSLVNRDRNGLLSIKWLERNGPAVSPPSRTGFGSQLLERGLAHEFGGSVRLQYKPDGVCCEMEIPLSLEDLNSGCINAAKNCDRHP